MLNKLLARLFVLVTIALWGVLGVAYVKEGTTPVIERAIPVLCFMSAGSSLCWGFGLLDD
jgi:regulator of protease activity HflC (stomatin/prohibitin superfamily)